MNYLKLKRGLMTLFVGVCTLAAAGVAMAQAYPSKNLQIVVPFPPGGPLDIVARSVGDHLQATLKQTVVVENRAGATGNLGAQSVVRAPADGYTLLITLESALTANPAIYGARMGFDAEKDLRLVASLATFNQMLVVNAESPIKTFPQFVEAAKKGMNYASAGNASPGHLTMEALDSLIGGKLNHVPYRGNSPAVVDILGGQVDAGFVATPAVLQHVASGKLVALAVSGSKRSPLAPTIPTIAELGYPDATTQFGFVLMVRAGTPDAVVKLLNAEVVKVMASEAMRARLRPLDIEPAAGTPEEAAASLKAATLRWSRLIKDRKIQGD